MSATVVLHPGAPAGIYRLRRLGDGEGGPPPAPDVRLAFDWPGGDSWDEFLDITYTPGDLGAEVRVEVWVNAAWTPPTPPGISSIFVGIGVERLG